jgi:hypothetical protein
MRIDLIVGERDNIEVKEKYGKVDILLGDVMVTLEIKEAKYLLDCLENTVVPEEYHRSTLENKIEGLEEKIADLENELDEVSNGRT